MHIRIYLRKIGLSQVDLAHMMNISQTCISKHFSGSKRLPKARVTQMAEYLHLSTEELATILAVPVRKRLYSYETHPREWDQLE